MPQPTPTTNGPIHSVTCPHCGKGNDFRPLQEVQLLDTGSIADCDHCQRLMEVIRVQPITVITVRKAAPGAATTMVRQSQPAARQATTLSPAATRKLLRGR